MGRVFAMLGVALVASGLAACRVHERPRALAEPAPATSAPSVPVSTPAAVTAPTTTARAVAPELPARVDRLRVPGDLPASIVRSSNGAAPLTVFMPGICSNANAYLQAFPEAARKQGGVVAIEGDQPCGVDGFRSFSWDSARQHARVEAALAAAGVTAIPPEGITLVGYSQGAALAEQMVQRWPQRYTRVVLIGAPTDPSPRSFARARALVTMSCERDVPARMRQAAQSASRAGIPATYLEMPKCTHGNIGDGERVFRSAFDWLRANERPIDPQVTAVPLTGLVSDS